MGSGDDSTCYRRQMVGLKAGLGVEGGSGVHRPCHSGGDTCAADAHEGSLLLQRPVDPHGHPSDPLPRLPLGTPPLAPGSRWAHFWTRNWNPRCPRPPLPLSRAQSSAGCTLQPMSVLQPAPEADGSWYHNIGSGCGCGCGRNGHNLNPSGGARGRGTATAREAMLVAILRVVGVLTVMLMPALMGVLWDNPGCKL